MILSAEDIGFLVEREHALQNGKERPDIPPHIFDFLREALIDAALDAAGLHGDKFAACGDEAPGYLHCSASNWDVYVPWHLADPFPEQQLAARFFDVGHSIAPTSGNGFCLSGSAVAAGSRLELGDLDFSQYLPYAGARACDEIERLKEPADDRVLLKAAYGIGDGHADRLPWVFWDRFAEPVRECADPRDAERIMLDFVVRSDLGILPASVVVLMSDLTSRQKTGLAKSSYVFQEAVGVAAPGAIPAWSLIDASELGRYLLFLLEHIAEFKEKKPLKALKRALSISYILSLDEPVDDAIELLTCRYARASIHMKRRQEVEEILGELRRHRVNGWTDAVTEDGSAPPDDDVDVADDDIDVEKFDTKSGAFFERLRRSFEDAGLDGPPWRF